MTNEARTDLHLIIPTSLKKRFKQMCLAKDTNMSDVGAELIERWLQENESLQQNFVHREQSQPTSAVESSQPTIAELLRAYLFINYRGISLIEQQHFARDCEVPIEQVQAALSGQPVEEKAAVVFAGKLKLDFEEFQALQPKANHHSQESSSH